MKQRGNMRNKILLVGSSEEQSRLLLERLFGDGELVSLEYKPSKVIPGGFSKPWTIETKYYSADVEFWIIPSTSVLHSIDAETNEEWLEEIENFCEGFLLVFDPLNPSSFDTLKRWTESVIDHCTASIMLCVGNDPRKEVEVALSEDQTFPFSSWSIANNFEYIAVNGGVGGGGGGKTFISRSLLDESDPEGAERILEALGSTMWENMIQKETTRPRLAVSTREGEEVEDNTSGRRDGDGEGERQGIENFNEASQVIEGLFKQYCAPPSSTESTSASTSDSATPLDPLEAERGLFESLLGLGVGEEEGEGEEEADIKAMENMFLHLREMRSKASSMPDQTRRELAAKVAITFAQLLGEDD